MTASIINYIVDRYLSNILEINQESTYSSLWNGTVIMENLKIKSQIFDQINLPYFELVNGYVGSIKCEFTPPFIYNYPIKVNINKVFFHARQKNLNKLNEQDEIIAMENYKDAKLQSIEEFSSHVNEIQTEDKGGMMQKILDNLQLEISDIVFRFDDDISYPTSPFVFGLILNKLLIKTTNDKFDEAVSPDKIQKSNIKYKLMIVKGFNVYLDYSSNLIDYKSQIVKEEIDKVDENFTIYLDKNFDFYVYCMSELYNHSKNKSYHHYLLFDYGSSIRLSLNDLLDKKLPKFSCDIIIESLILNLELKQISVLFKLLAYLNLNNLYRVGINENFYKKEIVENDKKIYMEKYIEYYKAKYVKAYLNQKSADKIKTELSPIEKGLTYDQIQSMRQAAMIKIEYLFNLESIDAEIKKIQGKYTIFSYFSSSNDAETLKTLQSKKNLLQEEEVYYEKRIQQQLALEKGIVIDMYKDLPKDYILYFFNLEVKKSTMSIGEDINKKLLEFIYTDFELKVLMGVNFQNIFLNLNDFEVEQYKFYHPCFNKLIESYADEGIIKETLMIGYRNKVNNNIITVDNFVSYFSDKKGALYIEFENNPNNALSNYRFKLRNEKRLYLFSNLYVLQYAQTKILDALQSNINLGEISNYAKGEVYKYIEKGQDHLDKIFKGEYPHFNIELDLLFKGPMIIFPQNLHDSNNTSCLIMSLGECQISSALPPRMDPLESYIKITSIEKMYDVYSIVTQGFQLSTMTNFSKVENICKSSTKLDMIENVNLEIKFGNLIQPKNEFFENFKLSIKFHKVEFYLRDIQIEFLIYLLDGLNQLNKLLKKELDNDEKAKIEAHAETKNEARARDTTQSVIDNTHIDSSKMININENKLIGEGEESENATANNLKEITIKNNENRQAKSSLCPTNKKNKNFFTMEFVLDKIEFMIMKSLNQEEILITSKTVKNSINSNYKNYLKFILNKFNFNLCLSENKNMKISLKIFNMFLFDYDYNYKLENNSVHQENLINPELQALMGAINNESDSLNVSRSVSLYSDAYEDPEIVIKKNIPFFIDIRYDYKANKNKSIINVNFTKLLLCPNLCSFSRLFLFLKYYVDLFNYVNKRLSKDLILNKKSIEEKIEEIKEINEIKNASIPENKNFINNKFMKKVLVKMEDRKKTQKEIDSNDINKEIKETQVQGNSKMQLPTHYRLQDQTQPQSHIKMLVANTVHNYFETFREKSKLKFSFQMKEIEMNFPLNPNSDNSKVLTFNFNMMLKMDQETEYDRLVSKDNKFVKINYLKNKMDVNLMIFNVDFDIINFRNNKFEKNLFKDKILSSSRLICTVKSFLILEKETNVTNLDLHIEPVSMIIGFRQVKVLSKYTNAIFEVSDKLKNSLATNSKDDELSTQFDQYKSEIMNLIKEYNVKLENEIKYNTANFNNLMDINFKLDKAIIKMIDNTSYNDIPLAKIECSKFSFKMITNSDPTDTNNMAQALIEMISRAEVTNYNIYNLYQYMDLCYFVEILFFNEKVNYWEPIMEPWNGAIKLLQVNVITRLKIDFTSDILLNLNLSYSSVKVVNLILKKLSQDEKDWLEENINYTLAKRLDSENMKSKNKDTEICLQFVNGTGIDLSFWLDVDNDTKFNLKNAEIHYFSKIELANKYKKITDGELALMNKDKFSFNIVSCAEVRGIDFSFNYYTNMRLDLVSSDIKSQHNFIELTIKIKNEGLIKSITFESNIMIYNNTNYSIQLHVMKTNDLMNNINKYEGITSEEGVNIEKNQILQHNANVKDNFQDFGKSPSVILSPNKFTRIPLNWMIDSYAMLGRIMGEEGESYKLFYEQLNFTYQLGDEYKSKILNKKENESETVTQELSSKYSKIVTFEYESNEQKNLSLDVLMLKSVSDSNLINNSKLYTLNPSTSFNNINASIVTHNQLTFNYILVINPILIIENQIPYNINFSNGKDHPDSDQNYISSNLIPLQKLPVTYVNYLDNRGDLQLTLYYFKNMSFRSENFSFLDDVFDNKKVIKLYNMETIRTHSEKRLDNEIEIKKPIDSSKDYYEVSIIYQETDSLNIFNYSYVKLEKTLSRSKKLIFYVEYLIVSKLDSRLFIKNDLCKEKDENIMKLTNNTIFENKVNLFNLPSKIEKAKLKSELSEWSAPFQINTHGVQGVVSLETNLGNNDEITLSKNKVNDKIFITDIAMKITSSSYFNHSTLIILEPHYILVNELGINLKYRQMYDKCFASNEINDISVKESKILTFRKKTNKSNLQKKYCQFIIDTKEPDFSDAEENWSSTINLGSLDEITVKLPIPKFEYNRIKSAYPQNVFTYNNLNFYLLAKLLIHTSDTVLIYIILIPPKFPQFLIRNNTNEVLVIKQASADQNKNSSGFIKIQPRTEVPYAWCDHMIPDKTIKVGVGNKEIKFSFDKLEKLKKVKPYSDQSKLLYFSIFLENKFATRVLKVEEDNKSCEKKDIIRIFNGKNKNKIFKFNVSLKGIGISIIDEEPKELFYISIYCLNFKYSNIILTDEDKTSNTEIINIYIKNFQIDYCLEDSFKYIIFPKEQIIPHNEDEISKQKDVPPFISMLVTRKTIHNLQNDQKMTKIEQIDFLMQEMNVKVDQSVLNNLLSLVNSFLSAMDFYSVPSEKHLYSKNNLTILNKVPGDYCPYLSNELESYDKIISENDENNMIFIDNLFLAGMKINLTLRIDISSLEIRLIPRFIIKILGTLGNALARITDSPLKFSEMVLTNSYTDVGRFVGILSKHYVKQGVIQFYKIIGSSDLIGNPVGLVDRLGTGFMEFFNEPRKGFLNGPEQFGKGIAKGVNSLLSNVIGGGFDTVGKITGTLYAATKNLKGEKLLMQEDEPSNLIAGAYEGIKGGFKEIGSGLAGIFVNPYKRAKQEGVKGFFKGVGTGLFGIVVSPFSAALKIGNSISIGLKNTATYFNRGKLKTERFRHPRHIIKTEPLKNYDENYAEVQAIIRHFGDRTDSKLIFFADFKLIDSSPNKETHTIIINDKKVSVIFNTKQKILEINLRSLKSTEVHIANKYYMLLFILLDGSKQYILTDDLSLCVQAHTIIQKLAKYC